MSDIIVFSCTDPCIDQNCCKIITPSFQIAIVGFLFDPLFCGDVCTIGILGCTQILIVVLRENGQNNQNNQNTARQTQERKWQIMTMAVNVVFGCNAVIRVVTGT